MYNPCILCITGCRLIHRDDLGAAWLWGFAGQVDAVTGLHLWSLLPSPVCGGVGSGAAAEHCQSHT